MNTPKSDNEGLINIRQENGKASVDARELHYFLEVGKDFSNWIKDRITKFCFVEGEDFATISRSPELASGNRGAKTDYLLSMDMAKELAMVERTTKGKQARQYFIECERRLKEFAQSPEGILSNPASLRTVLLDYTERVIALETTVSEQERQIEEAAPKCDFFDAVTKSEKDCSVAVAAQTLSLPYGGNTLFKKLRERGLLISGGSRHNLPKQRYIEQGLFNVTEGYYIKEREVIATFTTLVTQKGLEWIVKNLGTGKKA